MGIICAKAYCNYFSTAEMCIINKQVILRLTQHWKRKVLTRTNLLVAFRMHKMRKWKWHQCNKEDVGLTSGEKNPKSNIEERDH